MPTAYSGDGPKSGVPYLEFKSESIKNPNGGDPLKIEAKTVIPRNEKELKVSIKWAAKELEKSKSADRNIVLAHEEETSQGKKNAEKLETASESLLEEVSSQSTRPGEVKVVKAPIPTRVINQVKQSAQRLGEGFYKHQRISLTLLKGSINGTITGTALVMSAGVPLAAAIPIATFTGLVSGAFMYFNPQVQRFFDGNPEKKERWLKEGKIGALKYKAVQLTKTFFVNAGVYMAINTVNALVGLPIESPLHEARKVFRSSLASTVSGGIWHSAIASETRDQINQTEVQAEQERIQFRSNLKGFGLSMVGTFGGILTLMGSNIGYWTMGIISVTGILYTARTWFKNRGNSGNSNTGNNNRGINVSRCRSVFAI